jgi:hypothetical protein
VTVLEGKYKMMVFLYPKYNFIDIFTKSDDPNRFEGVAKLRTDHELRKRAALRWLSSNIRINDFAWGRFSFEVDRREAETLEAVLNCSMAEPTVRDALTRYVEGEISLDECHDLCAPYIIATRLTGFGLKRGYFGGLK